MDADGKLENNKSMNQSISVNRPRILQWHTYLPIWQLLVVFSIPDVRLLLWVRERRYYNRVNDLKDLLYATDIMGDRQQFSEGGSLFLLPPSIDYVTLQFVGKTSSFWFKIRSYEHQLLFLLPSRPLFFLVRGGTCPHCPYRLIAYDMIITITTGQLLSLS